MFREKSYPDIIASWWKGEGS